jgi:hypothetical protein
MSPPVVSRTGNFLELFLLTPSLVLVVPKLGIPLLLRSPAVLDLSSPFQLLVPLPLRLPVPREISPVKPENGPPDLVLSLR